MNNSRRKTINAISNDLEALLASLDDIKVRIEEVRDEEQESYDNMPESLQESDRGQTSLQAVESLEEALDLLSELTDSTIIDNLNTATE